MCNSGFQQHNLETAPAAERIPSELDHQLCLPALGSACPLVVGAHLQVMLALGVLAQGLHVDFGQMQAIPEQGYVAEGHDHKVFAVEPVAVRDVVGRDGLHAGAWLQGAQAGDFDQQVGSTGFAHLLMEIFIYREVHNMKFLIQPMCEIKLSHGLVLSMLGAVGCLNPAYHILLAVDWFVLGLAEARQALENLPLVGVAEHDNSLPLRSLLDFTLGQLLVYFVINLYLMDGALEYIVSPVLEQIAQVQDNTVIRRGDLDPVLVGTQGPEPVLAEPGLLEQQCDCAIVGMGTCPGLARLVQLLQGQLGVVQVPHSLVIEFLAAFVEDEALLQVQSLLQACHNLLVQLEQLRVYLPRGLDKLIVLWVVLNFARSVGVPQVDGLLFLVALVLLVQDLLPQPRVPPILDCIKLDGPFHFRRQLEELPGSTKCFIDELVAYPMVLDDDETDGPEGLHHLLGKVGVLHVEQGDTGQDGSFLGEGLGLVNGSGLLFLSVHHGFNKISVDWGTMNYNVRKLATGQGAQWQRYIIKFLFVSRSDSLKQFS